MLKRLSIILAFCWATSAFAVIGSIKGTAHDFSTGASGQICVNCHTPHNASGTAALWNRTANVAQYTLYASPTAKGTVTLGATSRLCLSCHDGTVAIDSFGGATGTNFVTGKQNLGRDLSNDHPVGVAYNAALVALNPGLKAITTTALIGNQTTGTIETKMLIGGQVECASCHDVHNSASGTQLENGLLRITSASSNICLACHAK